MNIKINRAAPTPPPVASVDLELSAREAEILYVIFDAINSYSISKTVRERRPQFLQHEVTDFICKLYAELSCLNK